MAKSTPSRSAERRADRRLDRRADRRSSPARASEVSWWDELPRRTQHLICLGLLLVIAITFYAPMLFSGKALVGGDAVKWREMAQSMIEYHEATGEEPLWSTNAFGGMPGYMITQFAGIPQIDTVAVWLRKIIWPLSHFLLLLGGVYALVVFLGGRPLAGLLGAVSFGLTSYMAIYLVAGHNSKYIALCFAPWLLLAFAYALRRPRLLAGLLFAAALAANLRAGHPQITYYVLFTLGVWWIAEGIAALRAKALADFGKATAWMALGAVLAALMVAHPYLIQSEYKDYTIRGAASESAGGAESAFDYAMAWSQGAGELLTLVVANAYGGGGSGPYWGPKIFTGGPHYVGGLVVLLALVALVLVRRRTLVAGLGVAALLMVLFSLGENFEAFNRLMYDHFPLFDAFRVPETWLIVVALVLAVLAGLGAAGLVREKNEDDGRNRLVLWMAGGAVVAALLIYALGPSMLSFSKSGEIDQIVQQIVQQNQAQGVPVEPSNPQVLNMAQEALAGMQNQRADLFRADALRTFFFLLLGGGLIFLHRTRRFPAWAMLGGLALLITIDLFGVGRRYLNESVLVPTPDLEAQIPKYDYDDFILGQIAEAGGPGHFRVLSLEAGHPSQNARPSYYYESLGGYHGAKLRLYQDYLDYLLIQPDGNLSRNALQLMGTRYVVAPGGVPDFELVFRNDAARMYVSESPDSVARAFFVGEIESLPDAPSMWQRIQSPAFDPSRTALVFEGTNVATTPLDSSSTARVTLQEFGPREIVWQAETDAPRLLVASEVYYPAGWKAFVDEEEVPIHQVDYLLRGVEVPAGAHTVRMAFEPALHGLGLWLSGVSTVLVYGSILALLGLAWRRKPASHTDR